MEQEMSWIIKIYNKNMFENNVNQIENNNNNNNKNNFVGK